jgi:hypothetical protein
MRAVTRMVLIVSWLPISNLDELNDAPNPPVCAFDIS